MKHGLFAVQRAMQAVRCCVISGCMRVSKPVRAVREQLATDFY